MGGTHDADDDEVARRKASIIAVVRAIPAGTVASYGWVAAEAGLPGRARLVGRVLGELPAGSGVPWHRVMRAGGRLAFPVGSVDAARQTRALAAEGVRVHGDRVPADVLAGAATLDRLLWGPTAASTTTPKPADTARPRRRT
jgi:methylated-DNA-protein-cysteine methyltransferase-like protein